MVSAGLAWRKVPNVVVGPSTFLGWSGAGFGDEEGSRRTEVSIGTRDRGGERLRKVGKEGRKEGRRARANETGRKTGT